jgi:hypothetical protein
MTLAQEILTKMMELPHRGSGTIYEEKAGEYLKNVYSYFGMRAKEVESRTLKNSLNLHLIISFALVLLTLLVNFLNITVLTLIVFVFSILVYLRLFGLPFRFLKSVKPTVSKNIYVDIPAAGQAKYTLVVTGHYDTGNDYGQIVGILGPIFNQLIASQFRDPNIRNITIPDFVNNPLIFANISFVLTLLSIFIPDTAGKFFFAFLAGVPLIVSILLLRNSNNRYSAGAYDNGVGTSLVVELASIFSKVPLTNTRLIFANVAAEETLTRGTIPLLNALNLDKSTTLILDLDCIGEEEVVLMHSEPSYPLGLPTEYDSSFELLVEFADEFLAGNFKISASPAPTDNQEVLLNGYRVMGMVTTLPTQGYPAHYHSTKDTIDRIKWDKVEQVRDFLAAFATFFDSVIEDYKP